MNKKVFVYIFLICVNVMFSTFQVQAVEKTPEYEFKITREKTYEKAKDPANYTEIENFEGLKEKYPELWDESASRFKFDSVTIDDVTCSVQPYNEGDILGQIEVFSEMFETCIVDGDGSQYTYNKLTREDLHRLNVWYSTRDIVFEESICIKAKNDYLGGRLEIFFSENETTYINFDKKKVRVKLKKYDSSIGMLDDVFINPYSKVGMELTGVKEIKTPKLEINGQQVDYLRIIDTEQLPDGFAYSNVLNYVDKQLIYCHEDGTICPKLWFDIEEVLDSAENILLIEGFEIFPSYCEGCTNEIKVAGCYIEANTNLEELKSKLSVFSNVDKNEDSVYSNCYFYDNSDGTIKEIEYNNRRIKHYCDYIRYNEKLFVSTNKSQGTESQTSRPYTEQDKEKLFNELNAFNHNYIVVE